MSKELSLGTYTSAEFNFAHEDYVPSFEVLDSIADKIIVLLGVPGSGKTTLANNLRSLNEDIRYISVGDISRNLEPESDERKYINQLFAQGSPAGDPEFFLRLIEPHVSKALESGKGFILDGIPKKSSEVQPLLDFLNKKGLKLDMVISCELDDIEAYNRLACRPARPQDDDSMNVFTNRTARYLSDLDYFKEALVDSDSKVHILKTGELNQQQTVKTALEKIGNPNELNDPIDIMKVAAEIGDADKIASELGYFFDETLTGKINYRNLLDETIPPDEKLSYIKNAYLEQDPNLSETPLFLKRLSENYLNNTTSSLRHLANSMIEEISASGELPTTDNITQLLTKQLRLKARISELQDKLVTGRDIAMLVENEIQKNKEEFEHIESCLNKLSLKYDVGCINISELAELQSKLWNQFTSKSIIFTENNNYRAAANGQPGSQHSLVPYIHNRRALSATSMAEYTPFVEAVSATEYKYQSTFGFIHFIGMDKNCEAYGAEYPIMMHDDRLLELDNDMVHKALEIKGQIYSNHDLWHNMVPVYAEHFILHHPDAPLSYGGRLPSYDQFGANLRREKEEYEIGMAMAHAKTQQELFEKNSELYKYQTGLVHEVLGMIPAIRQELSTKCSPQEVQDISDFLAKTTVSSLYNILPASDPAFDTINAQLNTLGLTKSSVDVRTIACLLYDQRLIDDKLAQSLLGIGTEEVRGAIGSSVHSARLVLSAIDERREDRESGSEYILKALDEFGILYKMQNGEVVVELDGLNEVRWIAIMAPQRQPLKGHMEKAHGKNGVYKFGNHTLEDVRELTIIQKTAIDQDNHAYNYRVEARRTNQQNSYGFYSIIFDDGQELYQTARHQLNEIRKSSDLELKEKTVKIVGLVDCIIDSLVKSNYAADEADIHNLKRLVNDLSSDTCADLQDALMQLADSYLHIREVEVKHQTKLGISYSAAKQQLESEQMDIV